MTAQFDAITNAICDLTHVPPDVIKAKKGKVRVRDARNMVCSILFHWEKMSHEEIGEIMSDRDRTTIRSLIITHRNLLETDIAYRRRYLKIVLSLYPEMTEESVLKYECGESVQLE